VLFAVADAAGTAIVEEPAEAVVARWKRLDRSTLRLAVADAKPLDTLLARQNESAQAEILDVCLAQYVLQPGVASAEFEPMAFQRLGAKMTSDKDSGVEGCQLPEGTRSRERTDGWPSARPALSRWRSLSRLIWPRGRSSRRSIGRSSGR
jgi:hypothetical protein